MVLLSSKFPVPSCGQPSVWLASVFHRPMDTRYTGRSIIIIKRRLRISVLPSRHQQRYLSLPTLARKSQAGFLALTIWAFIFEFAHMTGGSWRICIFARPLITSRRIAFRAKLENAAHFLAGDSHQIATNDQFPASKLARIDHSLLLGSELSIFNFQCSQTAFAISAFRITIFANYIGIMLA